MAAESVTQSFLVAKQSQTIILCSSSNQTLGTGTFSLSATSS